jgi:predicted amidohydrolase YtcJ
MPAPSLCLVDHPRPSRPSELVSTLLSLADHEGAASRALPNSFRDATRARGAAEAALVLANCQVLDAAAGAYLPGGPHDVHVRGGSIQDVHPSSEREAFPSSSSSSAVVLDVAGHVVMPGLCDAHVHCTAVSADLASLQALPESLVAARCVGRALGRGVGGGGGRRGPAAAAAKGMPPRRPSRRPGELRVRWRQPCLRRHCGDGAAPLGAGRRAAHILQGMLCRGFTTVRDAGGADFGLAQAVEEGDVLGPRLLFTGQWGS